jgi:putative membrane protein
MNKIVVRFLAVVLGLFIAEQVVSGISINGLYTAVVVAVCLGVLNLLVRPILLILTLPITILTFGLFVFVLNALLFLFIGSFVKGFEIDGFIPALLGSFVVSLISWIIQKIV